MAATLEDSTVTYEELADLEREFEEVETEILRRQVELTRPLYEKRAKVVAQIPNFWPLVLEQAPPEIDEFVQPTDAALLLSSLTSLSVSHFEIEGGSNDGSGDPRSVAIRLEFADNDYFEDRVIEKKFWYRRSLDGWSGLVSEPVEIRWKKDKDLTNGLLSLVKRVWDQEQQQAASSNGNAPATAAEKRKAAKGRELTPDEKQLKAKIEEVGLGGMSLFAWFGYRGPKVSAEENRRAIEKEKNDKKLRLAGKKPEVDKKDEEDEDDDEEWDELEIFPEGDTLAIAIAEDLWPNALKFFTQAQEQDALSDMDFESDEDAMEEGSDTEPPSKKVKS
ncbi:hypothetical protein VTK73DRAFT_6575 [Phialemonium thermophilum]|uniref:Nap family protein n=1 Tax=Phialemonium thermophilum TaxID=223376 RepID=A0ABR3WJ93_9PEZI